MTIGKVDNQNRRKTEINSKAVSKITFIASSQVIIFTRFLKFYVHSLTKK